MNASKTRNAGKISNKALLFVACACMGQGAGAIDIVKDPASPVDIVAKGYNGHSEYKSWQVSTPEKALEFTGDATVTLAASAAAGGVFSLYCNIFATNRTITVEAETGIDTIRWIGGVECDKVIVKGASAVVFGDAVSYVLSAGKNTFSYFGADVEFADAASPYFAFTNAVTLAKTPTSCAYTIADGTLVAAASENVLGSGGTFTVEKYDVSLCDVTGVNADKIVVGNGRFLTVYPCMKIYFGTDSSSSYSYGRWAWLGASGMTIAYDFELKSGSLMNVYGGQVGHTFTGNLSGTTAFEVNFSVKKLPANLNFAGSVDLCGTLSLTGCSSIHCNGDGPFVFGDLTCADYSDNGNTFTFKKSANGSIGSLTGGIKVVGDGDSTFTVGALAANAVLDVDGAVRVTVGDDADLTATVNLLGTEGGWTVSGPSDTVVAVNLVPETAGKTVNLGGKLSLGALGDRFGTLNLLEGAELTDTTFDASVMIAGKGRVVYSGTSWKDKIYFWGDGSDADSMVPVREQFPGYVAKYEPVQKLSNSSIEYDIVFDWKDCRGDDLPYIIRSWRCTSQEEYNKMSADPRPTYPIFASNVYVSAEAKLPGYMSFAGYKPSSRNAVLCNYDEKKSEWNAVAVSTPYAIVVFGSQQGGGSAILGTTDGSLGRSYSTTYEQAGNAMFTNKNYEVYADGTKVDDSTVAGLNGGWQILSINTEGNKIHGLGFDALTESGKYASSKVKRGCSNYAEIMLFSEAPTELERKVIEERLAVKWGLACSHSDTREAVTLAVEVGGTPSVSALVAYPADDIPRAFMVNVNLPSNFKSGVEYPILSCPDTDTVTLGAVTGRSKAVRIVRRDGVAYLQTLAVGTGIFIR